MADFFTGNNIVRSYDTNKGLDNGWLPINGKLAVQIPDCDSRYWKIVEGAIVEMDASERELIDNPPIQKTADDYFNSIMSGLTPQEQIDFLDVYDDFPSFSLLLRHGDIEGAKSRIDAAEGAGMLTEDQANKIIGLMDGT